ncbi:DNA polymerase III subunit beta [Candidatus Gracilibacteria bacterium GN02-872]|nr:DNA polymerase III subunit beta [Candidatus Gracilibacteria bacterium GN02-872]RKW21017.1 MAG: DNA polymerase III subunit beta [Candidatus Gracilibacteria bacterium]
MKFSIETEKLKKGLDIVNHATANISTTPILENILIKVNENSVILTSNNLELAIEYFIEDVRVEKTGSFCLPSKLLTSYVSLVQDDEIKLELLSDLSVKISNGGSTIKIKGIEASEFPLIPNVKEEVSLMIPGKVIKKSIDKTLFSSSEANIRPTLAGIYVNIEKNNIVFASTDTYRLSEYRTVIETENKNSFSQIIPSKTCNQIRSVLGEEGQVKIVSGDSQIAFFAENINIYSRLLNGKFPEYLPFFPSSYTIKAEINRTDLIQALRKINLISKEKDYYIKMSLSTSRGIELETTETQIGEGDVTLVGVVEGEDNAVGINSNFLLEVLSVIETTHISISFENPRSAITISPIEDPEDNKNNKNEFFRHILMPLRI